MSSFTIAQCLVAGLEARDMIKGVWTKQGRFLKIERKGLSGVSPEVAEQHKFWFVGPKGALRCGRAVSKSYAITDSPAYKEIIAAGQLKLDPKTLAKEAASKIDLASLGL